MGRPDNEERRQEKIAWATVGVKGQVVKLDATTQKVAIRARKKDAGWGSAIEFLAEMRRSAAEHVKIGRRDQCLRDG